MTVPEDALGEVTCQGCICLWEVKYLGEREGLALRSCTSRHNLTVVEMRTKRCLEHDHICLLPFGVLAAIRPHVDKV